MDLATTLCSRFLLLAVFLFATAFFLAGCDVAGVGSEERPGTAAEEAAGEPGQERGALKFSLMSNGTLPADETEGAATAYSRNGSHGCYLAVRDAEAEGGWRYHSVYLHYPQEVVEEAGSGTEQLTLRLRGLTDDATYEAPGGGFARLARCNVPASREAMEMAYGLLLEASESAEALGEEGASSNVEVAPSSSKASGGNFLGGGAAVANVGDQCQQIKVGYTCVGSGSAAVCGPIYGEECGGSSSPPPSDGGDDGGGSDDPWPSDGEGGGGSGSDDDDDGSGSGDGSCGTEIPEPGSECAPTSYEQVSKEEVAQKFEQKCGVSDPYEQDRLFEANARVTLGMAKAQNPIYSQALDGADFGVWVDGEMDYNLLNAVMEVKYSEGSGSLSFDQSEHHIDALYDSYQQVKARTNYTAFAPAYWAVTLSSNLTRLDYNSGIVPYANSRNVVVYHARLFLGSNNNYYLRGETIGNSFGAPSVSNAFMFPFDCNVR